MWTPVTRRETDLTDAEWKPAHRLRERQRMVADGEEACRSAAGIHVAAELLALFRSGALETGKIEDWKRSGGYSCTPMEIPPLYAGFFRAGGKNHASKSDVIICHLPVADDETFFGYDFVRGGETVGSFAMAQLSGIVSLFFIAAAFLTSCNQPQQPQGSAYVSVLRTAD
jgi:hypothetical protein